MKDWALVFTQGAIPGNGKHQRKLIKHLAQRGFPVVEAFGDNMRIHNPGKLKDRIITAMKKRGQAAEIEADGTIYVPNFPVHASGHGREEDFRMWLQKLDSKMYGGHHTDDPETVFTAYRNILTAGKTHPGALFKNHEQVEITLEAAKVIGHTIPSVVLTREKMEDGKQFNKQFEATRYITYDDRHPNNDMGLRGTTGGPVELHFGMEDMETVRRRNAASADHKIPDTRSEKVHPKPLRLSRGTVMAPTPAWGAPPKMAS